jgi:hypothetical protein
VLVRRRRHATPSGVRSLIDWLFRDRKTGKITVWQWPNVPLCIFIVAALIRRFAGLDGGWQNAVSVVATVALLWWAVDELLRGVNPARRILGGAVLAVTIGGLIVRTVS